MAAGGSVGTPVAALIALAAVVVILLSARPALRALDVVELWHVGEREARDYPKNRFIRKPVTQARGEMLQGWVRQFCEEREANNEKADDLACAVRRLSGAFVILAGLLIIVCVRAFGV